MTRSVANPPCVGSVPLLQHAPEPQPSNPTLGWVEVGFRQGFPAVPDRSPVGRLPPLRPLGVANRPWPNSRPNSPCGQQDEGPNHPNSIGNDASCCASSDGPPTSNMVCKYCHMLLSWRTAKGSVNSWETIRIHKSNQLACGSFTSGMRWKRTWQKTSASRTHAHVLCVHLEPRGPSTLGFLLATLGLLSRTASGTRTLAAAVRTSNVIGNHTSTVPHLVFPVVRRNPRVGKLLFNDGVEVSDPFRRAQHEDVVHKSEDLLPFPETFLDCHQRPVLPKIKQHGH